MMEDIFKRECAGGNAVAQMMNQMGRDATGREKLDLAMEGAPHLDEFQQFMGGGPRELLDAHSRTREFFGIEDIDDLDPTFAGPRELHAEPHGEFDRMLQGPPRPGMVPPQEKDKYLHSILGDFIHSSQRGQGFMPMQLPDLGMSALEKQKIRNRSNVVARHVNPDQEQKPFVESQLGALFDSLSIGNQRTFQQPPRNMGNEWAGEFAANQRADEWAQEFEQHHPWLDGYREWQREDARRSWVDEYKQFDEGQFRNFQNAWKESVDEGWRNEFEQVKDTLDDKINYHKYLESLSTEEKEAELRHLGRMIAKVDDPKLQASKFIQMMSKIGEGELKVEGNSLVDATPTTATTTTTATTPMTAGAVDPVESWLSEYNDFVPPSFGDVDFAEFERQFGHLFPANLYESILGPLRPYEFQEDNPFLDHPNPMEKGIELFNRGELGDSILAFEAVVQRDPENSDAWRKLGESHAENDRDDRAIAALSRACTLRRDDAEALLALAVSCTNDSMRDQAFLVLKSWLENHPRYKDHHEQWMREFDDLDLQDLVTAMYIEAAKLSPMDPDENIQIALGLLFNISQEYDKAVDCFRTALTKRPDDYLLWNKLGATLANSSHSREALEPYYKSLSLKPTYTRARANLGISYLNLELYDEAATQFLQCLALQPAARHIWMNLQTVFSRMNRDDLLEKSLKYEVELFRGDFEF